MAGNPHPLIRPEKVPGRGRGRPKNPFKPEKVPSERGRGRPKGSTKKARGRPAQKHQTVNESSTSSEDFCDATDEVKAESSEESNSTSSSDDSTTTHEEMNNTNTESVSEKKTDKAGAANKGKGQNQKKYLEKKSSNQEKDSDKKAEKSGHKQGEKLNDIKESLSNPVGIESKKGQPLFV